MNPAARKQEIMKILRNKETAQVIDLARILDVSKVTIRTDLDELENKGLLVRTYGGAILPEDQDHRRHIDNTLKEYAPKKLLLLKKLHPLSAKDRALSLIMEVPRCIWHSFYKIFA